MQRRTGRLAEDALELQASHSCLQSSCRVVQHHIDVLSPFLNIFSLVTLSWLQLDSEDKIMDVFVFNVLRLMERLTNTLF